MKGGDQKWLWWQIDGKNFNNDNSGEFLLPSSCFTRIQYQIHLNFHKIFAINLLDAIMAFLTAYTLLTPQLFWIKFHFFL